MTLQKTGEELGISGSQARSTEHKALRTLRAEHREELLQFLPEYIEAKAYSGSGVAVFKCTWTSSTERAALLL